MGEEIEIYILKRLTDAITIEASKVSKDFNFADRLLPKLPFLPFLPNLHKDFTELKDLIEKKRTKIRQAAAAAAAAAASNAPAPPRPRPAGNVTKIPDASKPSAPASSALTGGAATGHDSSIPAGGGKDGSKVLLPAGDVKKSEAPPDAGDEKERGAPTDVGDKKDTGAPSDAGDKKETGAPMDAGDKKEIDTPSDVVAGDKKEVDAPSDVVAGDKKEVDAPSDAAVAGDKKEVDPPSDAVAGDKKEVDPPLDAAAGDKNDESSAPSDASDKKETSDPVADSAEKESDAPLATTSSKTTSSDEAKASTSAAGGGKKESNVGTSAEITSQDESEISPATDSVKGDKSITPAASVGDADKESNVSKTATFAKTTSLGESENSPVTDDDATDHKSKTLPASAGGGKKESGVPLADKSSTSDAKTKSDDKSSTSDAKIKSDADEENLLREQLYYLNNVLTEWQMITKKPFSCSSDSVSSITKTLKKIKQDLKPETTKKADESSHSSDNDSLVRPTPEVEFRWSTRLVNLEKVHGFEDKILSLERLLVLPRKDTDTFKAFGIHGMAGVGKTTLCQSIFSRPKVSEYFFPRIWVCLSTQKGEDEDNRKEVVKRMLRCLGIDDKIIKIINKVDEKKSNKVDEKKSLRGLLFALRLQLTGKRYFIVLDDAHDTNEWFKMPDSDEENDNSKIYEKFSYGLPKECGGTVIVTSRVEQVVKNMVGDEENLRCIEPLTDQETCWKIFKDTVMEDDTPFPEDLNKLKLEIVKRCDGLPLAAKLLGQIKHKELRENPTAGNHQAAVQAGIQQAAVEAAK